MSRPGSFKFACVCSKQLVATHTYLPHSLANLILLYYLPWGVMGGQTIYISRAGGCVCYVTIWSSRPRNNAPGMSLESAAAEEGCLGNVSARGHVTTGRLLREVALSMTLDSLIVADKLPEPAFMIDDHARYGRVVFDLPVLLRDRIRDRLEALKAILL